MKSFIAVNDILDDLTEENKRLSNELIFAKKFLKILIEFKSFVDLNFNPIKHNFDSNVLQKFNDFNKDIGEKLKQKSNILSDNSSDVSTNNFRKVIKPEDICLTINSSHGMKYNEADNPNLIFNEEQPGCSDLIDYSSDVLIKDITTVIKSEDISLSIDESHGFESNEEQPECSDIAKGNKNLINKKVYNKVSNEIRDLIIRKMDSGLTGAEVAEQLDQNPSTVRKIYRIYKQNGIKYHKKKGHRKERLSEEQKQMIIQWIENDCQLTVKDLQTKCLQEWPELISIGMSTISKALKSFHYSFKRTSLVPEVRNTPEVIEKRGEYVVCDVANQKRNQRIEINSNERNYKCLVNGCNKSYKDENWLKIHTNNSHSGIKYLCDWPGCEFETFSKTSVQSHNRTVHNTEPKFICDWPQCGKRFKTKDKLKLHLRIHTNDKRYACSWPGCQYRCVISGNLNKHMKIHRK